MLIIPWGWPFRRAYTVENRSGGGGAEEADMASMAPKKHALSKEFGSGLCEEGKLVLALLLDDERRGRLGAEGRRSLRALQAAHDGSPLPDVSAIAAKEAEEPGSMRQDLRRIDF